jgi:hypothetical protein
MALANNAAAGRKSPEWLSPQWEKKKQLTAARVEEAVQALKGDGGVVSYAAIRERVHSLSGVWISANTIKRNDLAYQIYLANRRPPRIRCVQEPLLTRLVEGAPEEERRRIQSKVSRLRRESKDTLIARLVSLERTAAKQKLAENALREEVIRLATAGTG